MVDNIVDFGLVENYEYTNCSQTKGFVRPLHSPR
jgi:hypothetical protein